MKNKNWLDKNIIPLIAIMLIVLIFSSFFFVLAGLSKSSETLTNSILDTEKAILLLCVGYYFGSSKGSKDKDKPLLEEEAK